jgi:hypothetical protein
MSSATTRRIVVHQFLESARFEVLRAVLLRFWVS